MTKKLERVLELGTMQEFLELSDEDMEKARTNGPRMADMINRLWLAVRQLADERNKEAAEVDRLNIYLAECEETLADLEEELATQDRPRDTD